jgi:hypothetical protein
MKIIVPIAIAIGVAAAGLFLWVGGVSENQSVLAADDTSVNTQADDQGGGVNENQSVLAADDTSVNTQADDKAPLSSPEALANAQSQQLASLFDGFDETPGNLQEIGQVFGVDLPNIPIPEDLQIDEISLHFAQRADPITDYVQSIYIDFDADGSNLDTSLLSPDWSANDELTSASVSAFQNEDKIIGFTSNYSNTVVGVVFEKSITGQLGDEVRQINIPGEPTDSILAAISVELYEVGDESLRVTKAFEYMNRDKTILEMTKEVERDLDAQSIAYDLSVETDDDFGSEKFEAKFTDNDGSLTGTKDSEITVKLFKRSDLDFVAATVRYSVTY